MSTWAQFGLQDAASPIMEELIMLHDFINLILVFIISFVAVIMTTMMTNKYTNKILLESQYLEYFWTIVPALILSQIAGPSIVLLYLMDDVSEPSLTYKVVGFQWYWNYATAWIETGHEVSSLEFDSYMMSLSQSPDFLTRLLDADNFVVLPVNTSVRFLVTAADVLHAWTVPSLGVKVDAVPGRLNQLVFTSRRSGVFFGQCSEICGANHSFMPIMLEFTSVEHFVEFMTLRCLEDG